MLVYATGVAELTAKVESERAKLQKAPQKRKGNTILHKKTVARLRSTVQSLKTNVESLYSEKEILRKSRNDAELTRDAAKARETLLTAQNSKLGQQLADVQKHVTTIRRFLLEYRSKLYFAIETGFKQFRRRFLDSACENVQSRQRGI